jgi:hypothetical protein
LAALSQSRQKPTVVARELKASCWLAGMPASPQDKTMYADWPSVSVVRP